MRYEYEVRFSLVKHENVHRESLLLLMACYSWVKIILFFSSQWKWSSLLWGEGGWVEKSSGWWVLGRGSPTLGDAEHVAGRRKMHFRQSRARVTLSHNLVLSFHHHSPNLILQIYFIRIYFTNNFDQISQHWPTFMIMTIASTIFKSLDQLKCLWP